LDCVVPPRPTEVIVWKRKQLNSGFQHKDEAVNREVMIYPFMNQFPRTFQFHWAVSF